jgi:hypothetical protein
MKGLHVSVGVGSVAFILTSALVPALTATREETTPAPRTIEVAEKERRSCVTCHTAFGRPELNEAGEYYRAEGALEGYPGELPPREGEPEGEPEPEREPEPEPDR